jgi:prepilin-type N-terminal cleavage/methylation domain-containing protein/prepilin-type processing-associated H-X9-DG protein
MRRGFSLIELLVVIGIVALLLGVLLPVLGLARQTGRAAVCLSNLRQMSLALHGYSDDHNDRFPLFSVFEPPRQRYWFGLGDASGPLENRELDRRRGLISPYLSAGVEDGLLCPAFPYDHPDFMRKFRDRACSYGININLAPYQFNAFNNPRVPVRRDGIARPSAVMTFADGVQFWQLENRFNEGFYLGIDDLSYSRPDPLDDPNGGFAHFRHGGRTQLSFLDGHARSGGFEQVRRTHTDLGGFPAGHLTAGPRGPDTIYGRTW